jgi:hypothetical protein
MRASGTRRSLQRDRSVRFKAGARRPSSASNPPAGFGPQPFRAVRVQGPSGPFNARWRREPPGGDTEEPEADGLRGSAQTADREQLNDERGVKPLPVSDRRDAAESGTAAPGWVREPLLYSGP